MTPGLSINSTAGAGAAWFREFSVQGNALWFQCDEGLSGDEPWRFVIKLEETQLNFYAATPTGSPKIPPACKRK